MTTTAKKLGHVELGITPTLVYTVPASKQSATIRSLSAANIDASSSRPLTVWLVPQGQVPDDTNILCCRLEIPQGGAGQDDAVHVLMAGGQVFGATDALGGMTLTVDGSENI